jgi:hypothetical protein
MRVSPRVFSIARVVSKGGRFGVDLVPDLPRWSEYEGRKTLSGRMGRDTRVSLVESVRQDRAQKLTIFDQRYTTIRGRERREHHCSLTFRTLTVPQMARYAFYRPAGASTPPRGLSGTVGSARDVWMLIARKRNLVSP